MRIALLMIAIMDVLTPSGTSSGGEAVLMMIAGLGGWALSEKLDAIAKALRRGEPR